MYGKTAFTQYWNYGNMLIAVEVQRFKFLHLVLGIRESLLIHILKIFRYVQIWSSCSFLVSHQHKIWFYQQGFWRVRFINEISRGKLGKAWFHITVVYSQSPVGTMSSFNFFQVHIEGAERLARISKEMGVEKFIHISALNSNVEHEVMQGV